MTNRKGIDVSHHNGDIEWDKLCGQIDFAIIRAGYGSGNLDRKFLRNARECEKNAIPYGFYWFSYAYTPQMAIMEADYCCDSIKAFNPTYPICFDFEYGSLNYAEKNGVYLKNSDIIAICRAFLNRVEERGYYATLYTNPDFLDNKGLNSLIDRYDLWIAKWGDTPPNYKYGMWQYGTDNLDGVGVVDSDIAVKDYPQIIENMETLTSDDKYAIAINFPDNRWRKYLKVAKQALLGIYSDLDLEEICIDEGLDIYLVEAIMDLIYA